MKQDNENWKRLSEVIRTTGHNINSFARHIGLPRGENLYQIQRGNNGVSLDVATRIHDKYPEYPIAWLMFGIEQLPCGQVVRIPLYYDYATMTFPTNEVADETLILSISLGRDAEFAVPYSDDILNPGLHGAILLMKQHREEEVILFGNIYLVDLNGMRLFRIIKQHDQNPDRLCLTTNQPSLFSDIVVTREQISGLWRVVGAVCNLVR
ncbi:MAG: hypothetical protein KH156_08955 [Alistipes sp.]|nr:hypothetical protein [Alistipes sp.]